MGKGEPEQVPEVLTFHTQPTQTIPIFITYNAPQGRLEQAKEFIPFRNIAHILPEDIVKIVANGEELQHIFNRYSSRPYSNPEDRVTTIPFPFPLEKDSVVSWYGDMAKMIVGNL